MKSWAKSSVVLHGERRHRCPGDVVRAPQGPARRVHLCVAQTKLPYLSLQDARTAGQAASLAGLGDGTSARHRAASEAALQLLQQLLSLETHLPGQTFPCSARLAAC